MAWLNAKPRPAAGSKRAERFDISKALTRAAAMRAKGITPQMPPLDLPHMLDWLTEIGLTGSTGMGMAPLSWTEINSWQRATSIRLLPWEARLIRSLSIAYVGEASAAEDEGCPAPWRGIVTEAEKAAELSDLQAVLG